ASLRRLIETEHGLFIAEGTKVIRRALEAGYRPRSFLLAERWLADLGDLVEPSDAPVYVVSEAVAEGVTGFHVHRGALASMHRHDRYSVDEVLVAGNRLVVLEDLVDHTNVGAIIRNAAGLGWDGLLISPRCADPLYRRSVKVSMGAVFSLPWARLDDHRGAVERIRAAGFTVVALALAEGASSLDSFVAGLGDTDRLAILLGSEGHGLSPLWLEAADEVVTIPMRAGIDSLNVAATSAIACYALAAGRR
ncbi:MAG: RNA methyltransferase, partial [Propionicimonas sp.]|nr:RNA methyltransferase [Propionicimonas sp.]